MFAQLNKELRKRCILLFDFDSTLHCSETLDELLIFALHRHPQRQHLAAKINDICQKGMDGQISMQQSLETRLQLVPLTADIIKSFIQQLPPIDFNTIQLLIKLRLLGAQIFVISNGFIDIIAPLCQVAGIPYYHVLANRFYYDHHQKAHFSAKHCPLIAGKDKFLKTIFPLSTSQPIIMFGDSITDSVVKDNGPADYFVCWQLYRQRDAACYNADLIVHDKQKFVQIVLDFVASKL